MLWSIGSNGLHSRVWIVAGVVAVEVSQGPSWPITQSVEKNKQIKKT